MRLRLIPFTLALMAGALASVIAAPAAFAHVGDVTISCTSVTFAYSKFPNATNLISSEVVTVDGHQEVSKSFTFTGTAGSDTVTIFVPYGTHSVTATADWTQRNKAKTATLTQSESGCQPPPPPCHHNPPPPPPCHHSPPPTPPWCHHPH